MTKTLHGAWGAHPADPLSLKDFSENRFQSLIETVPVVGEVGLDRRSAVSLVRQQEILESIFRGHRRAATDSECA